MEIIWVSHRDKAMRLLDRLDGRVCVCVHQFGNLISFYGIKSLRMSSSSSWSSSTTISAQIINGLKVCACVCFFVADFSPWNFQIYGNGDTVFYLVLVTTVHKNCAIAIWNDDVSFHFIVMHDLNRFEHDNDTHRPKRDKTHRHTHTQRASESDKIEPKKPHTHTHNKSIAMIYWMGWFEHTIAQAFIHPFISDSESEREREWWNPMKKKKNQQLQTNMKWNVAISGKPITHSLFMKFNAKTRLTTVWLLVVGFLLLLLVCVCFFHTKVAIIVN